MSLAPWTNIRAQGCAVFCENGAKEKAEPVAQIINAGPTLTSRPWGCSPYDTPLVRFADLLQSNYQLESRMREICQSGSERGAKRCLRPYPFHLNDGNQPGSIFIGKLGI